MAKDKINIKKQLRDYKFQFGLLQRVPCSSNENKAYTELLKEDKPLPENVVKYDCSSSSKWEEFYTIYTPELTEQEILEYLTYKKLSLLNTIKNCVVFFTVLTIVSLFLALIWGMNL